MAQARKGFDSGWIREMMLYRDALFSTVAVVQTADRQRLNQFIQFAPSVFEDIFLFKIGRGLFKREIDPDRGVEWVPVTPMSAGSGSPLAEAVAQAAGPIRDLPTAIVRVDSEFQSRQRDTQEVMKRIAQGQPTGILFIVWDPSPPPMGQVSFLSEAVRGWASEMGMYQNRHFVVIFTPSPTAVLGEETLRHTIYVEPPLALPQEREILVRMACERFGLPFNPQIVDATSGLNLAETESVLAYSQFKTGGLDPAVVARYKTELLKKQGLTVLVPRWGFEAVGGYDTIKGLLQTNIIDVYRHIDVAQELGIDPPRGVILYGPPGTGKTHTAKALAGELGMPFIQMSFADIASGLYGEAERKLARALKVAEAAAPCVLFFDEIDQLLGRGRIGEHETSRRLLNIFMSWLGERERKVLMVGATNRPQDLDLAFIRAGRFDMLLPVLWPDEDARLEILKVHTEVLRKVPLADDVDLREVARETKFYSGAELERLIQMSALEAMKAVLRGERDEKVVTMDDFKTALAAYRPPGFDKRKDQLREYMELARRFSTDARFVEALTSAAGVEEVAGTQEFDRFALYEALRGREADE